MIRFKNLKIIFVFCLLSSIFFITDFSVNASKNYSNNTSNLNSISISSEKLENNDNVIINNTVNVSGTLVWNDSHKTDITHALINVEIDLYILDTDEYICTVCTDENGSFSVNVDFELVYCDSSNEYYELSCRIKLSNNQYKIVNDLNILYEKNFISQYSYELGKYDCSLTIDDSSNINKALQIDQILKLGYKYINVTKYWSQLEMLTISYPFIPSSNPNTTQVSHYVFIENKMYIEQDDYSHPDVILHELGHHFFKNILGVYSPGGSHFFGELLTSKMSIDEACKLSWNEAIATYFSIGLQQYLDLSTFEISFLGNDLYENVNLLYPNLTLLKNGNDHNEYSIAVFLYNITFDKLEKIYSFNEIIEIICTNQIKDFTTFIKYVYSNFHSDYEIHKGIGNLLEQLNLSISLTNEKVDVVFEQLVFESNNDFSIENEIFVEVLGEYYIYDDNGVIIYQSEKILFHNEKGFLSEILIGAPTEVKKLINDYSLGVYNELSIALKTYVDCGTYQNVYYSSLIPLSKHNIFYTSDILAYSNDLTYVQGVDKYYYLEIDPIITNTYKISYLNPDLNLNENYSNLIVVDSNFNILYDINNDQAFKYLNDYETNLELVLYGDNLYYICLFDYYNNWGEDSLSKLTIDIADMDTTSNCDDYYINSYELFSNGYFWETIEFSYYGKFKFNFSINNSYSGIINLTLAIISNNSFDYIIYDQIKSINRGRTYTFDINPSDKIYICLEYPLMENGVIIDIMRSNESNFLIIPDKKVLSGGEVGTEVLLNKGEYESTTMTIGFTKCMFLDDTAISPLRSSYYWFVDDENKATISSFGTLHAKHTGAVTVYAVYKNDYSIYSKIRILILEETRSDVVELSFGLDVRSTGVSCGTYVSECNGNPVLIGKYNEVNVFPIAVGKTRLICLGNDSPADYLQYFTWTSNDPSSSVSLYGTIKANYFSDNIVTITGVYKYNPRFKIVIYIKNI